MDNQNLDLALRRLAEIKNELSVIAYAQVEYDHMEEEVHRLEDEFMDNYGEFLETIIADIHASHCPESEVLIPIAYMANTYLETAQGYDVKPGQGVSVQASNHPNSSCYLVLVPGPTRLMLLIGEEAKETVWELED